MRGLDEFITGHYGEDQFRPVTIGEPGCCAWCHQDTECRLIPDPEGEIAGDKCWVCSDCIDARLHEHDDHE